MTDGQKAQITLLLATGYTMRKYQKQFHGGDKSALKKAMFYEKEFDKQLKATEALLGIPIPESKGPASQGTLL